jgi:hypothetical protein
MSSHENARVLLHKSQVYRAPRATFSAADYPTFTLH